MWKILDISGFRTSSTTHCKIIKYQNSISKKINFELEFLNDFETIIYLFDENNIVDISKFNNILKNNGSSIYYSYIDNRHYLTGKKLKAIFENDIIYNLDSFSEHPLDFQNITEFTVSYTKKNLLNIMNEIWCDDYSDFFWKKIFN